MNITLLYAQINSATINELSFISIKHLEEWLHEKVTNDIGDRVYLFTHEWPDKDDLEQTEIYVTEKIGLVADLITQAHYFGYDMIPAFHLQEYDSYEEAYKVALNMKELSPLCYSK